MPLRSISISQHTSCSHEADRNDNVHKNCCDLKSRYEFANPISVHTCAHDPANEPPCVCACSCVCMCVLSQMHSCACTGSCMGLCLCAYTDEQQALQAIVIESTCGAYMHVQHIHGGEIASGVRKSKCPSILPVNIPNVCAHVHISS